MKVIIYHNYYCISLHSINEVANAKVTFEFELPRFSIQTKLVLLLCYEQYQVHYNCKYKKKT